MGRNNDRKQNEAKRETNVGTAPEVAVRYVEMDVADLAFDEANPRTISQSAREGLERSIERFGLVQPIVWNERTKEVVGGHQRLDVLRSAGVKRTMVAVGSWTREEQRALNVTLNNTAIQGEFTNAASYLDDALKGVSLDDFRTLQLDTVFPKRGGRSAQASNDDLSYRLLVICTNEEQQAELLDEFIERGLEVKPLIV